MRTYLRNIVTGKPTAIADEVISASDLESRAEATTKLQSSQFSVHKGELGDKTHSRVRVPRARVDDCHASAGAEDALLVQLVDTRHVVDVVEVGTDVLGELLNADGGRQLDLLGFPHIVDGRDLEELGAVGGRLDADAREDVRLEDLEDLGAVAGSDLLGELLVVGALVSRVSVIGSSVMAHILRREK